jgi:SpoVK/Ycf46/Vps4 family AAA+-type ATPase
MTRRSSDEHEASRRLKTEFLIGLDQNGQDPTAGRVLLMAATNCPEDLDDALVRRMARRIFIPTPTHSARLALLKSLLAQPSMTHTLSASQLDELATRTDGYSNSDLTALIADAALGPLRGMPSQQLLHLPPNQLPPITRAHFEQALAKIRPSVSKERLHAYEAWVKKQDAKKPAPLTGQSICCLSMRAERRGARQREVSLTC